MLSSLLSAFVVTFAGPMTGSTSITANTTTGSLPTIATVHAPPATVTLIYTVEGMKCDGCSGAITAKVKAIDGVVEVAVARETKTLTVTAKEAAVSAKVEEAVKKLGYTITRR